MCEKRDINEYLYYEFGFDIDDKPSEGNEGKISEAYPYELEFLGSLKVNDNLINVYEFYDGEIPNVVLYGNRLSVFEKMGMDLDDLHMQIIGSHWIGEKNPIDLCTTKIGYDNIPTLKTRRDEIEKLAFDKLSIKENLTIIEGLFLVESQQYIALVKHENDKYIIGSQVVEKLDKFRQVSAWRLLSWGIGSLINRGIIK